METHFRITLAIEAAIAGGSISLIDDTGEIASWIGKAGANKAAEELMPAIDQLLTDHNIRPSDIGLIAASAGPGSFTGIRVGLATALGLKAGWGIPMASESALVAIAAATSVVGNIIVAVPAGRSGICWQRFSRSASGASPESEPLATSGEDFERILDSLDGRFVLHSNLARQYGPASQVIDLGSNIALAIGLYCRANPEAHTPPLFLSKKAEFAR